MKVRPTQENLISDATSAHYTPAAQTLPSVSLRTSLVEKQHIATTRGPMRKAAPVANSGVSLSALESQFVGVNKHTSYAPKDAHLWDSWILQDADVYRLYHLHAPKSLDVEERHDNASIHGAISTDMRNWTDVGEILGPGPKGAWDDKTIWTGETIRHKERYLLFYTGRNNADGELQRIGLATSSDGVHFERGEKPLLEPDGRWYETTEESPIIKAWRDPTVVRDDSTGKYLMYFTAKTKDGDENYKGCIGIAVADNIEGPYEAQAPVLAPGKFAQMEVPQIIQRAGKVFLLFNSLEHDYSPEWAKKIGGAQTGLVAYVGDSLRGPFEPMLGHGVVVGTESNLYTVKLEKDPERPGEYVAYGWYMRDKPGQKAMTLAQPMPVHFNGASMRIKTD